MNLSNMGMKEEVEAIYTDFAKAFDRILYHIILLHKMDALDSKDIFRRISLYSIYNN